MKNLVVAGATDSWAQAINSSGTIVGYAQSSSGVFQPYMWTSNGAAIDLGLPPGAVGAGAYAISSNGMVAGSALFGSPMDDQSFIWTSSGGFQLIGQKNAYDSYGINDAGVVVGTDAPGATVWTSSGGVQQLTSLTDQSGAGWFQNIAWGINDAGQIAGVANAPTGAGEAVLLTPLPEPSTWALLAIGGLALAGLAISKRRARRAALVLRS